MKPTDREKKRYVLFEIVSEGDKAFTFSAVEEAILSSCKELLGAIFMGEAGIQVLQDQFNGKRGIIRVNNNWAKHLKVCLGNIYSIKGEKISINIPKISGILRKLKEK